jgi:metallo-beta-lactamase class B
MSYAREPQAEKNRGTASRVGAPGMARARPGARRTLAAVLCLLALGTARARAQGDPSWSEPVEPFQIAEKLYYVGTRGISAFLLVGSQGAVLIDTGPAQNAPLLRASVEKLGLKLSDIKILLSSHAHFDHVGGHAALVKASGARVMAMREDAAALAAGEDRSALGADGWAPVKVDRELADGDGVELGELSLTAHWTPGHTQGCTTWTTRAMLDGEPREVVFVGGTSINRGVKLLGNPRHPSIAEDYARTFQVLKGLQADIFLAQHPPMFGMDAKLARQRAGEKPSPFLDATGYRRFVSEQEEAYLEQLRHERAAAR